MLATKFAGPGLKVAYLSYGIVINIFLKKELISASAVAYQAKLLFVASAF